jgi:hypothetical protein
MNVFEIAVLRVLIKRQQPMKLSILVSGFPDDSEDNVLSAISSLKLRGYLVFDDYQPNGYISINRERRKEILQIVDSDIHVDKFQSLPDKEKKAAIPIPVKKSPLQVAARHLMSSSVRTIAVSSLLIVGLVSAIGISIPTATSPDSQFVAYPGYMAHKKWSITHADDDHEGHKISNTPSYPHSPPIPASFLAIKDCNQKPLQGQQQT